MPAILPRRLGKHLRRGSFPVVGDMVEEIQEDLEMKESNQVKVEFQEDLEMEESNRHCHQHQEEKEAHLSYDADSESLEEQEEKGVHDPPCSHSMFPCS
ncbi:hypothetical protein J5N97_023225 [Dioscorea zingiberensis]|uniref:Uncharacterized protein n=1 Tax=Dioscorea zingiberensis TaxID=325984 RepID=A0A9D5CBX3_9LILI|nr:hypothetical protein J5N97_023225 [Dioscorea zingiberensis]